MTDDTVPRALVGDDDALIRMDAADILLDAGFRPYEACGAADAITIPEDSAGQIQRLFTDVQMPGGRDEFALARDCAYPCPHIEMLVAVRCSSANRSVPR